MMIKKKIALLFLTTLGACSLVPKHQELSVYQLPTANIEQQANYSHDVTIQVYKPYSSHFLDTKRIAVVTPDHELAVFSGIRWDDSVPVVFRDSLVNHLRKSGYFKSIANSEDIHGDWSLRAYINHFEIDYSKQPGIISLDIDMTVINNQKPKEVIRSKNFTVQEPLNNDSTKTVINTFGKANDVLQNQIVRWLADVKLF